MISGKYNSVKKEINKSEDEVSYKTPVDPIIMDNDALETISGDIIRLSDRDGHKNVVVIPAERSMYTEQSIEKEMDTKLWQLYTPLGVEPILLPHEKPTKLFIRGNNYRWITADGVNVIDTSEYKDPWVPAGKETRGKFANPRNPTLLYAPGDGALFYPREVENYIDEDGISIRAGLIWEWKLNGKVISTQPFAWIANLVSQGLKWEKVSPHTITCTVKNEHGELSEDMQFSVADDVYHNASTKENQRIHEQGWYEFDEVKYWKGKTSPITFQTDPRFAPRTINIKKIKFDNYGTGKSKESKFTLDPDDNNWIEEAQYKIDGGPWIKARNHSVSAHSPWQAYHFQFLPSANPITWTAPGMSQTTIEFKYKYRYFKGLFGGKKYHRTYYDKKIITTPSDESSMVVNIDSWAIPYTNKEI